MNCKSKNEAEIQHVLEVYGNLLYRTAIVFLGNTHDVQDVLQEVLLRYMEKAPVFRDQEHEKAWLLKVTSNLCKDFLRQKSCRRYLNLDEIGEVCSESEHREILKEVLSLPQKYKSVILLHYIEGYQVKEIAHILNISENAVKKRLQRGKETLRINLNE